MNESPWVKNVFRPLIVGGMLGAIAVSLVNLIRLFFPSWSGIFMVAGCALATIEANYSYRLIRAERLSGADLLRFRTFELALLFILLRIGSYIGVPWSQVLSDVRTWPQEPWRIVDPEVGGAFILALWCWTVATQTTKDLERIGEPVIKDKYYVAPVDALTTRFFWGGAILLALAGITRIGLSALLNLSRPSVPGLVLNVLIYFVLGLAMMGHIRYAQLTDRWRKENLDVPKTLVARWVRYTLLLLTLAGVIAFLLPTAYTLPLLDVASIVIGAILYVFNLIFQLLMLILLLLLYPLAKLFGVQTRRQPMERIPPPTLPPTTPGDAAPAWLEIVRSVAFWAVALGIVVYVFRSYLRDRPDLGEALIAFRPIRILRQFLVALWRQLTGLADAARERLPARLRLRRERTEEEQQTPDRGLLRFFRLGSRSRRERMLYYYLSILRRAARQGYPRDPSQTPYEYDTRLGPTIPQAERALEDLTEAFVETRYSQHAVEREQEERTRDAWKRVRAAVRAIQQKQKRSADEASSAEGE